MKFQKVKKILGLGLALCMIFSNVSIAYSENSVVNSDDSDIVEINNDIITDEQADDIESYSEDEIMALSGSYSASTVKDYALSQVGTTYKSHACLAWVRTVFSTCYGYSSSACCAYKYGSSYIDSTSRDNIPIGADVFFSGSSVVCSSCGNHAGHVGIYVGDGYIVHCWSGVIKKTTIDYVINCGYPYRGWGLAC